MFPQVRAKVVEFVLRLIHGDADRRSLEAARQRDAEEVGLRADRSREGRAAPRVEPNDESPPAG